MQQLVQLETARSEHSRGERQIQNKIDLRKGLWACETEQPSQTLVFTKTAGHKTREKKSSTIISPFFSFSFSIFFCTMPLTKLILFWHRLGREIS